MKQFGRIARRRPGLLKDRLTASGTSSASASVHVLLAVLPSGVAKLEAMCWPNRELDATLWR